jgi:type IV secretion system protein TrbJ
MVIKRAVSAVTIAALLCMGAPQPAHASAFVGATEITQLLNHVELVSQYIQQVQQYATQLQQYQNQLKMMTTVPTQLFSKITNTLTGLQNVVQGGNALSYAMANMDSQFTSKFASLGFSPTTSYASRYAMWSKTSLDTTQKALDMAHLQNSNLQTEAQLISMLQTQSKSSDATVSTVQVGNQIAAEQLNQLMELRQLMMADMSQKAAFQAQQIANQDEEKRSAGFYNSTNLYNGDYTQP